MALEFDPLDDIEMCSNCFEDEEYDFGLCVACVELAMEEIEEMGLTNSGSYGNLITHHYDKDK